MYIVMLHGHPIMMEVVTEAAYAIFWALKKLDDLQGGIRFTIRRSSKLIIPKQPWFQESVIVETRHTALRCRDRTCPW